MGGTTIALRLVILSVSGPLRHVTFEVERIAWVICPSYPRSAVSFIVNSEPNSWYKKCLFLLSIWENCTHPLRDPTKPMCSRTLANSYK